MKLPLIKMLMSHWMNVVQHLMMMKVGLKMNLPTSAVPALSSALPAEKSPTVSPLLNEAFCAVEVVVDENAVKDLVPLVRALGGTGIVTYPINLAIHS